MRSQLKCDEKARQAGFKSCSGIARAMEMHYQSMGNCVDHRSINASAEAFNSKIKAFRAQSRGVRNIHYV
jgi:transposase